MEHRPADAALMQLALAQARQAAKAGEVPVGAVLADASGRSLSAAGNGTLSLNDPTAHAEILCLRRGAETEGNHRLTGLTLVVTLEPCLMCVGAAIQARLERVVFGAFDPKAGALVSHLDGANLPFSNHHFQVAAGVLELECSEMLREFFRERRKMRRP
ncbi:MAG: nucleoside deaminase [Desulfovibrionaceae bacterium]